MGNKKDMYDLLDEEIEGLDISDEQKKALKKLNYVNKKHLTESIKQNQQREKELVNRNKREQQIMKDVDDEIDNWTQDDWNKYLSEQSSMEQNAYKMLHNLPEYQILVKNKAKMEKVGAKIVNEFGSGEADGIDNLYHRRGMYEIGQRFHTGEFMSPAMGLMLGVLKEGADIYKKYRKKMPIKDILLDSFKDMSNNIDGLDSGLFNSKSFDEEFQNFDYKHNRRRNR